MMRLALIGHPVAHSLSPVIHGYWLEKSGIAGSYELCDIEKTADLGITVDRMVKQGYAGFNVTAPYKQDIMVYCAGVDDAARAAGAVNTVKIDPAGRLHGYNTDAAGFAGSLAEQVPGFDYKNSAALVLGAGGGARAVLFALRRLGVQDITLAARVSVRIASIINDFRGTKICEWNDRDKKPAERARILVNCTPLGQEGQEELPFNVNALPSDALVSDIVYRPLRTGLLKAAAARGLLTADGLGMLIYQAQEAFRIWAGRTPDVDSALCRILEQRAG